MTDEAYTTEEAVQPNPFTVDQEEFEKAGLWDRAPFNFRFVSMKPAERESKDGNKYSVIAGRLTAIERANYDDEGNLDEIEEMDPERSRFQDFPVSGNGLQMLKSAYHAVTGRQPQGQPVEVEDPATGEMRTRYQLDILSIAEELVGSTAWSTIWHTTPDPEEGKPSYDRLSKFRNAPPQRFSTR